MMLPLVRLFLILFFNVILLGFSLQGYSDNVRQQIPTWEYKILKTAPHQEESFTQGWIKQGEIFYESSGLYGRSFIRQYSDTNNKELAITYLPQHYFAEGLTLIDGLLYLLTWKEQTLFILNPKTLSIQQQLRYAGEGWGLSHNGTELIMSDGSSTIQFRSPEDFSLLRRTTVHGMDRINELEYINGILWANRWHDDAIYAIDNSGCILGKVDLKELRSNTVRPDNKNVLNGIAYDDANKALWVTGKYWPERYLIQPEVPEQHPHCDLP